MGFTNDQATALIARFRHCYGRSLTDAEWQEKEIATERVLRKEWGKDYERKLTKAYALADAWELRFAHGNFKTAIDNGALIDAGVLLTLGNVANNKPGVRADIGSLRARPMKANQGSQEYKELSAAIENHYKSMTALGNRRLTERHY